MYFVSMYLIADLKDSEKKAIFPISDEQRLVVLGLSLESGLSLDLEWLNESVRERFQGDFVDMIPTCFYQLGIISDFKFKTSKSGEFEILTNIPNFIQSDYHSTLHHSSINSTSRSC